MNIQRKTEKELTSVERFIIKAACKRHMAFEIVQRGGTIFINANNQNADQMENIITKLLELDYLDSMTKDGKTGEDLLNDFAAITNEDASDMLTDIFRREKDSQTKTAAKAHADAWKAENTPDPEFFTVFNTEVIKALYLSARSEARSNATGMERTFSDALNAVFYYGYMAGKAEAE